MVGIVDLGGKRNLIETAKTMGTIDIKLLITGIMIRTLPKGQNSRRK